MLVELTKHFLWVSPLKNLVIPRFLDSSGEGPASMVQRPNSAHCLLL